MSSKIPNSSIFIGEFIQELFILFSVNDLFYCIERNYEGYPQNITGDIDIIVKSNYFIKATKLIEGLVQHFNGMLYYKYCSSYAVYLGIYFCNQYPNRYTLTIELFPGGVWKGITYLSPESILYRRKVSGITWRPEKSDEAIITLMHHLLYNNKVYDKYKPSIYKMVKYDSNLFEKKLGMIIGNKLAVKIKNNILIENWNEIEHESRLIKVKLLMRTIFSSALLPSIKSVIRAKLDSRRKSPGLVVNVLSNKINDAEELCKRLKQLAIKWHIFMPPNRKIINNGNVNTVNKTIKTGGIAFVVITREASIQYPLGVCTVNISYNPDNKYFLLEVPSLDKKKNIKTDSKDIEFLIWEEILQAYCEE